LRSNSQFKDSKKEKTAEKTAIPDEGGVFFRIMNRRFLRMKSSTPRGFFPNQNDHGPMKNPAAGTKLAPQLRV
jgi:hypothetical protein